MADFSRRHRFTTRHPRLKVAGTLPVGRYRFELVVEDSLGRRSRPAWVEVVVVAADGAGPGAFAYYQKRRSSTP